MSSNDNIIQLNIECKSEENKKNTQKKLDEWINKQDPVSFETLLDIGLLWYKYCYEKNYSMQFESLKETISVEVKRKDNEEDYFD